MNTHLRGMVAVALVCFGASIALAAVVAAYIALHVNRDYPSLNVQLFYSVIAALFGQTMILIGIFIKR